MRNHAVPIALASSTTCARRLSNRSSAPENVNAISRPISANTAVSIEPTLSERVPPWLASARRPIRRPATMATRMPTNSETAMPPPTAAGFKLSSIEFTVISPPPLRVCAPAAPVALLHGLVHQRRMVHVHQRPQRELCRAHVALAHEEERVLRIPGLDRRVEPDRGAQEIEAGIAVPL